MQLRRPTGTIPDPLVERFEHAEQRHLPAEVALVELSTENRLVHALQLAERELLGQQLKADGRSA